MCSIGVFRTYKKWNCIRQKWRIRLFSKTGNQAKYQSWVTKPKPSVQTKQRNWSREPIQVWTSIPPILSQLWLASTVLKSGIEWFSSNVNSGSATCKCIENRHRLAYIVDPTVPHSVPNFRRPVASSRVCWVWILFGNICYLFSAREAPISNKKGGDPSHNTIICCTYLRRTQYRSIN
jgi:hypothetical protein